MLLYLTNLKGTLSYLSIILFFQVFEFFQSSGEFKNIFNGSLIFTKLSSNNHFIVFNSFSTKSFCVNGFIGNFGYGLLFLALFRLSVIVFTKNKISKQLLSSNITFLQSDISCHSSELFRVTKYGSKLHFSLNVLLLAVLSFIIISDVLFFN